MAGGKLEVQIGADITDFEKKIKEVEFDIKELSKVKLDRLKVGLDTTEINAQIKDAKTNLNSLKTTVKDTGNAIGSQFTKQVGNGSNTLTQFSRIAQDAPFGIIGIGNNITATAESFSYLKQQTGSTGGALKALASSLAGTGGILLGVSLLTTGLTLLAQSGLSVGDVIDKITGRFNALKSEMQKVNEEAAKSSGAEIVSMKALVSVAQDETKSRQDRLIAVKELQKEFPSYFGNLSTEKILNGDLTGITKELTTAIVERAKATAYADKIGELASAELKLNGQLLKAKEDLLKAQQDLNRENAASVNTSGQVISGSNQNQFNARTRISSIKEDLKDIRDELTKNKVSQDAYTSAIYKSTAASIGLKAETVKAPKEKKVKSKNFEFEPAFIAPFVSTISGLGDTMAGFEDRTKTAFQNANISIKENTDKMKIILTEFNDAVNELIQNSIATTFSDLGNVIGNAIATGGNVLSAIGTGLIQSLGSFLSALGDKLITYGLLLAGFGKAELAFKVGDSVTKIGAGIAMVALGVAAKAAGAAVSSFGSGGLGRSGGGGGASSSSGAGANNQSFTSSGFSGGNSQGGTVVFEIAGQKLVGVLNNTLNGNRRLGGTLGLG